MASNEAVPANTSKAPVVDLLRVRVLAKKISRNEQKSGWRILDRSRVDEIKQNCYNGQASRMCAIEAYAPYAIVLFICFVFSNLKRFA